MRLYRLWHVLIALCWLKPALNAQQLPQAIYWTRYYLRVSVSPRTSLHWEADNRRFFAPVGGQHQFISHLHAHRAFGQKWEGWLGVSYSVQFAQRPEVPPASPTGEKRLWQALSVQNAGAGKTTVQQRLRLEERFFRRNGALGHRFAFRARYAISAARPLAGNALLIKIGDEAMAQWGEGIRRAFDQNRLWAALESNWNKGRCGAELQYIWLWQQHPADDLVYDRDVLRLTLTTRITR